MEPTLPCILTQKETAAFSERALVPYSPPVLVPTRVELPFTAGALERSIFAFRVLALPDLLTLPNLAGASEAERLSEVLERQRNLVNNLAKWKGLGFSLRFSWDPRKDVVDMVLLGRTLSLPGTGPALATHVAADVHRLLSSFDYPVEPITQESTLRELLLPWPRPFIVEVRQRQDVVQMLYGSAYVVYPFQPNVSSWVPLFGSLVRQTTPCLLNVHLEPTLLAEEERQGLEQAIQLAQTLSEQVYQGWSQQQQRLSDPVAQQVSRLYMEHYQRLGDPLAMVVQAVSEEPFVARTMAQSLAAEAVRTRADGQPESSLPAGFDVVVPEGPPDLRLAQQTLSSLQLCAWGPALATPGKERLPYLVDARSAGAFFRFPVPLHGGVPGVRTAAPAPSYEVGARQKQAAPGEVALGALIDRGGLATVPLNVLTRHAIVAGSTGSGKTTTVMGLLVQLWEQGIPFLVIEPARAEYRALQHILGDDLLVFTFGNEEVSPFRLNPLEVQPGIRVETHLAATSQAINAAVPTFGPLAGLIEEALLHLYLACGWEPTERVQAGDPRPFPLLGDLYREVIVTTEERGYKADVLHNIRAAAAGRIGPLLRGSKGRTLNTCRSIPPDLWMNRPIVFELQDLTEEEQALTMLFLLTWVYEYCQVHRFESHLQHLTVVEEAHLLMSSVPHQGDRETAGDGRAQAVDFFSRLLSEVRAYGEGLLVADQIPGRLTEDVIKNTNLKIIHRLPGQDDRQSVGAAMHILPEQEDSIATLPQGQAAFYTEGMVRPAFVTVSNVRAARGVPIRIPDAQVGAHMQSFRHEHASYYLPFAGCSLCPAACRYRGRVESVAYTLGAFQSFRQALFRFEQHLRQDKVEDWGLLVTACQEELAPLGVDQEWPALYCYFLHLLGKPVAEPAVRKLQAAFQGGKQDV